MAEEAEKKSPEPTSSPREEPPTSPPGAIALEADTEEFRDNDSALGSTYGSETSSLASSILKFREENGRRYHAYKAGAYFLPNDNIENDRLDLQHNLCILMQENQLYLCPAGKNKDKPLKRVLDAGCGTGIWSMDFADENPETAVVGVDLSPIQPSFVPPNVEFFVDDLESEWKYSTPFDFIYMRMLTGSISNWPKLLNQAYKNLAPGGYIELSDPLNPMTCDDGTLPPDSPMLRWTELLVESSTKLGVGLDSPLQYEKLLEEAGFVDIVVKRYKWPVNTWPKDPHYKELGAWVYENMMEGIQALSLALFTRALNWTVEELEVFLVDVRKDLRNRNKHAYWHFYTIYAQKAEE